MKTFPKFIRVDSEPKEINKHSTILSIPILTSQAAYGALEPLAAYMNIPNCLPEQVIVSKYKTKTFGICKFYYYKTDFSITLYPEGRNLGTLLHEWTHGLLLHEAEITRTPSYRKVKGEHCELFCEWFVKVVNSFNNMITDYGSI